MGNYKRLVISTLLFSGLFIGQVFAKEPEPVYVGFDGAYGIRGATSASSIELGIKVAISEINARGGVLNGRPLKLKTLDNRSVPARGIYNLKEFAKQQDLVAVFGGRFSPVLLQQIALAHELKLPLLDVWAAADGITSHEFSPSYTFRLSLKDSWAMPAMLNRVKQLGKKNVGVMLPNTGWGRSNMKALNSVSSLKGSPTVVDVIWYNWGERDLMQEYQTLVKKGAEAIVLVANDIEGSLLLRQLAKNPSIRRLPIISHWGVTGGNMFGASGPILQNIDFNVVQTFSFFTARPTALKQFSKTAREKFSVDDVTRLASPVGVGHAYDMMHILAKAIDIAGSTDRSKVRDALEKVRNYDGLVRFYKRVFSKMNHDALSPEQVFMARYREDGIIIPIKK